MALRSHSSRAVGRLQQVLAEHWSEAYRPEHHAWKDTSVPRLATLLRTVAIAALGGSLLALTPSAPAAPPGEAARLVPGPAVGDCHQLTYRQGFAESDSRPPVDCADVHNTLTVAVVTVAEDTTWSDADAVWGKVGARCYRALDAALGRTARARERSAYSVIYFIPTPQERADGARWVRCDASLWGRGTLRTLPHTSPLLEQPITDRVDRCLTGKPFNVIVCAQKHVFRATGAARMRFTSFPSQRKVQAFAERKCPSRVSSPSWRYTYPMTTEWKAGRRYLVCYTKTRA